MQKTKQSYLSKTALILALFMVACGTPAPQEKVELQPQQGKWRMLMALTELQQLPFTFELSNEQDHWMMEIINHKEKILVDEIERRGDSLFVQLPIFESEFHLKIVEAGKMEGIWINRYKSDDYQIPVKATFNQAYRFKESLSEQKSNTELKYEVTFGPNSEDPYPAIGIFQRNGNLLSGTFATETGDYRHLEGNITADSLFLSTFDGSHAFLFKAAVKDSLLEGTFWSGTHYQNDWTAVLNPSVNLKNPDSLTFLKEGYDRFAFELPNTEGETISLSDEKFKNKAIIVQIMGSWCPNCLDETQYLSSLYQKYNQEGLEVVALAFERTKTKERALQNLNRLKQKTGAKYEFLLGGATREDKAEEVLPMLNHIMSYPTAIFINKEGDIQRIHTGFYGPSTGSYYDRFVKETEELVQEMIRAEQS